MVNAEAVFSEWVLGTDSEWIALRQKMNSIWQLWTKTGRASQSEKLLLFYAEEMEHYFPVNFLRIKDVKKRISLTIISSIEKSLFTTLSFYF